MLNNLDYDFDVFQMDVYTFNKVAGKHKLTSHKDLVEQYKLIEEELKEMKKGLYENDPEEVLDGAIDVLVTTIGFIQKLEELGMNINLAMLKTAVNNWSKFTPSETVAIETAEMYDRQGIDVDVKYNSEYDVFVIKDENDKVRKPSDFTSNDLKDCVPQSLIENGFYKYKKLTEDNNV